MAGSLKFITYLFINLAAVWNGFIKSYITHFYVICKDVGQPWVGCPWIRAATAAWWSARHSKRVLHAVRMYFNPVDLHISAPWFAYGKYKRK